MNARPKPEAPVSPRHIRRKAVRSTRLPELTPARIAEQIRSDAHGVLFALDAHEFCDDDTALDAADAHAWSIIARTRRLREARRAK